MGSVESEFGLKDRREREGGHEMICILEITFCSWFDTIINLKDIELVDSRSFDMKQQQTCRGTTFYVAWMRGMLVYNSSLIPERETHTLHL